MGIIHDSRVDVMKKCQQNESQNWHCKNTDVVTPFNRCKPTRPGRYRCCPHWQWPNTWHGNTRPPNYWSTITDIIQISTVNWQISIQYWFFVIIVIFYCSHWPIFSRVFYLSLEFVDESRPGGCIRGRSNIFSKPAEAWNYFDGCPGHQQLVINKMKEMCKKKTRNPTTIKLITNKTVPGRHQLGVICKARRAMNTSMTWCHQLITINPWELASMDS